MMAHELATLLLAGPNLPVVTHFDSEGYGNYVDANPEQTRMVVTKSTHKHPANVVTYYNFYSNDCPAEQVIVL